MSFNWRIKELLPGTKVHYLTIIKSIEEKSNDGSIQYLCKCDCGNECIYQRSNLNGNRRKSCGCQMAKSKQKAPGEVSYRVLYTSYKKRAEKDKLPFELTYDEFKQIIIQNCVYDGTCPKDYNTYVHDGNKSRAIQSPSVERAWIKANGIDRVDPDKGYILENCVPCCAQCNYSKSDYTLNEFLEHNKRMYEFQQNKK